MNLSAAIVCKDNRATIARTLASVAGLADEVVAVDSGSTDGTLDLLHAAGARVIRSDWLGYVATKQKALDACAGRWILALDSDESVLPPLAESIRAAIDRDTGHAGYLLNRKVYYRDRPLHFAWQPEWRLRLVRRGACRWGGLDPHDHLAPIDPEARTARLAGDLRHDSIGDGFSDFLAKQARHARTMAASMHTAGRRGSRAALILSPPAAFAKQLLIKRGFLDGAPGWLAAASAAAAAIMKHAALIEIAAQKKPPDNAGGS